MTLLPRTIFLWNIAVKSLPGRSRKTWRSVHCTIRLLKIGARSVVFNDFDEYERPVTAARDAALVIVLLGGDAGLRAGEMWALRWADLDLEEGQIRVECSEAGPRRRRAGGSATWR